VIRQDYGAGANRTANQKGGWFVGCSSAPPPDGYAGQTRDVTIPTQLTMRELRAAASAQSPPQPGLRKIDVNEIPFGLEIEMENVSGDRIAPTVTALKQWSVHPKLKKWKVVEDASLRHGAEAVSPVMKLAGGQAVEQIRRVYRAFRDAGGSATNRCGLHIHIDANTLGEKGLQNLMRMCLEQEALLFRISQNGHPQHRGTQRIAHNMQHYYARPLANSVTDPFSLVHADNPNQFRNALYGQIAPNPEFPRPALPPENSSQRFQPNHRDSVRYHNINFNSYWYQGTVEFRIFDAVDDPEQAITDLEMVLGMVKAAAEDDYTYLQTHPLGKDNTPRVSREAFEYFMSKVAPSSGLRERLTRTFQQSGGVLDEDTPVTDPRLLNVAYLQKHGYVFRVQDKPTASPFEIIDEMSKRRRPVTVEAAGDKTRQRLGDTSELERYARDVQVKLQFREEDLQRIRQTMGTLSGRGYHFVELAVAGARPLEGETATLGALAQGRLSVRSAQGTVVTLANRALLDGFVKLACDEPTLRGAPRDDVLAAGALLARSGYVLSAGLPDGAGGEHRVPVEGEQQLLNALESGQLRLPVGGTAEQYASVRDAADLQRVAAIAAGGGAVLDEGTQETVERLSGLESKGVRFSISEAGDAAPLNRVGQEMALRGRGLHAMLPRKVFWDFGFTDRVGVSDVGHLQQLAAKFEV
jgi:hypothetical protein